MNTLKRIYVMLYLTGAVVLTVVAARGLLAGDHWAAYLGVLFTVLPIVLMLSFAMLTRRMARTSANFPVFIALGVVGLLWAGWDFHFAGGERAPVWMALAGLVGFLLYVFWYSRFGRKPSPAIAVGTVLPAFEVLDSAGNAVPSSQLTQTPAVLIFIRGNWCPLCMGQVNEMAAGIAPFVERGIRVAFIAPQSVGKTATLAKGKPDGLDFYSDTENAAGRRLGIDNPASLPLGMELLGYRSETVLPTVIAVAAGGEILWTHETDNYRVRPTPDALLAVFNDAG
ncbi:redoxin domain-containing protein [uncultured Maricaulis sp.]|uniref:redoxin domain-containing protein n=1 Tax=uncultured Maricaulis sp. TaxID=174710 RepID=UPI0030DD66A7|tara:strand:+ start:169370 stop:170218 length:849 start_codon:yes stop_codon:yes gene_type:complete